MENSTIILEHNQILHKVKRISYEILEHNLKAKKLWLGGLNERGFYLAKLIKEYLKQICAIELQIFQIEFPGIEEGNYEVQIDKMPKPKKGDTIILIDDVLNSGKPMPWFLLFK